MKRAINTNVLNGFINQAVSHNKYLEESEMWKKKLELERTESSSKSNKRHHRRDNSRDNSESKQNDSKPKSSKPDEIDDLQVLLALYKDAKNEKVERWDHSGFNELYPDHKTNTTSLSLPKHSRDTDSDSNSLISSSHKKKKIKSSKHKKKSRSKHKKKHKKKKDS